MIGKIISLCCDNTIIVQSGNSAHSSSTQICCLFSRTCFAE